MQYNFEASVGNLILYIISLSHYPQMQSYRHTLFYAFLGSMLLSVGLLFL